MRSRGRVLFLLSALALVASSGPAQANHDFFGRVSAGEINGNGDNLNTFRAISADGSRVFFDTNEQLVANDTDIFEDIYERSGGRRPGSRRGNGAFNSFFDASRTTARGWSSRPLERLAARHRLAFDLYERAGGTTTLVSAGESTATATSPASFSGASTTARGSSSSPTSSSSLRHRHHADLYERSGGTTTRVSAGADQRQRRLRAIFARRLRRRLAGLLRHGRAARRRRHRQLDRRLPALRRHDDAGLGRPDQRQRRLRGQLRAAPPRTARGSSSRPTSSSSPPTPTARRTLRALRRDDDAGLGRPDQRQRRLRRHLRRRLGRTAPGSSSRPTSSCRRRHRQLHRHLRALGRDDDARLRRPDQRQRRLRRLLRRASDDGTRVLFNTSEQLVATDTDANPTSTSARAARRRSSRAARSTATGLQRPHLRRAPRTTARGSSSTPASSSCRRHRPLAGTSTSGSGNRTTPDLARRLFRRPTPSSPPSPTTARALLHAPSSRCSRRHRHHA